MPVIRPNFSSLCSKRHVIPHPLRCHYFSVCMYHHAKIQLSNFKPTVICGHQPARSGPASQRKVSPFGLLFSPCAPPTRISALYFRMYTKAGCRLCWAKTPLPSPPNFSRLLRDISNYYKHFCLIHCALFSKLVGLILRTL